MEKTLMKTLDVDTDVIIIGETRIVIDGNSIYELTLTDGKTYAVVFERYAYYEGPSIKIILEITNEYGTGVETESIYLSDIDNSITKCIETGRKLRNKEE